MIRLERKLASDATTWLTRFVCDGCGRVGCWLTSPEAVRRNATIHITAHANGDI